MLGILSDQPLIRMQHFEMRYQVVGTRQSRSADRLNSNRFEPPLFIDYD